MDPSQAWRADELSGKILGIDNQIQDLIAPPSKDKKDPILFNDMISALSEIGVQIDGLTFSKLSASARTTLSGIGVQIIKLNRQIEKLGPDADVSKIYAQRAALFDKASDLLIESLHTTGQGISDALSRVGATENILLKNLTQGQLDGLLRLDAEIERLRSQLQTADPSNFLEIQKALAGAADNAERVIETLADSTEIYSIFKDWEKEMSNALRRGAQTGFEHFKNHFKNLEFEDYMKMRPEDRKTMSQESLSTERLLQVMDSPNLSREMVEVIQQYGLGNTSALETMEQLRGLPAFQALEESFKSPMEKLNGSMANLESAVRDNTAAQRGKVPA
jgi:hypothetical protein